MRKTNNIIIITLIGFIIIFIVCLALGFGWSRWRGDETPLPTPTVTFTPTFPPTSTPTPTPTQNPATSQITVYFSKVPESYNDPTYVVPVTRTTSRVDVGTFAVEQLIAKPLQEEQSKGLVTDLVLSGNSTCNSKDFTLNIDANKKATLKFCRVYMSPGTMADARIINTLDKTLKQFPTIEKLIILTYNDHCFGDLSGLDICKGI